MEIAARRLNWTTVLAFVAIYFVWGSTYFAIRVLVQTVPPLFAAGVRFSIAGAALLAWAFARGADHPTTLEWRRLAILGAVMFCLDYSLLFWAEKTIGSGIASVLIATVPIWTAVLEVFVAKRERGSWSLTAAVAAGLAGVALVTGLGTAPRSALLPSLGVLLASLSWAIGTAMTKSWRLPPSKLVSSGAEMLLGGVMLLLCSLLFREFPPWPHITAQAFAALLYLITGGSIVAFTAYLYLLDRLPATKVASYAYVNPVVALLLGGFLGGEPFTRTMAVGSALILVSVAVILRRSSKKQPV